jgi:putative Mg2+ transporter-C (MgtC) family protein
MSEADLVLVGRIALAALLGYAIGFEREARGKAAGQRTFALVALGAAAFTGYAVQYFPDADRVIQGVVAGIGFLGAGLIFRAHGGSVQGLTTAASAWAIAAIGVLAGSGSYWPAVITTVFVLAILELNYVLRPRGSGGEPDADSA